MSARREWYTSLMVFLKRLRASERAAACILLAGALSMAGCADSGDAGNPGGMSGAGGSAGSGGMPEPKTCELSEGMQTLSIEVDGQSREYIVDVPSIAEGESAPLLVNMHGYTSNFTAQRSYMLLEAPSPWDGSGFVRVYPNGLNVGWNAGTCCGDSASDDVDDVAFIRALVGEFVANGCADEKRVYATGMSNGGFMSYRLACEASDLFAAVAPVAAVLGLDPMQCEPERAVPVMAFNGTGDVIVPYEGGMTLGIAPFASVEDSIAHFAALHGCSGEPEVSFMGEVTTCSRLTDCDSGGEVALCTSEGGGHSWPGITPAPFPPVAEDISASGAMLDFFNRYRLP